MISKLCLSSLLFSQASSLLHVGGSGALEAGAGRKTTLCTYAASKMPGAGLETFTPFESVYKDGYMPAGCLLDELLQFGDKFGTNKFQYKMGSVANISIVRYEVVVAKEDRKPMSTGVCYEFCRTVPGMGTFGIAHGRDCYCAPYFSQIAGDSSECDEVCEGNNAEMCGGHTKSSVFMMHTCDNAAGQLEAVASAATTSKDLLVTEYGAVNQSANDLQKTAQEYQQAFGLIGDVAAADLMQQAMVQAGQLAEAAGKGEAIADKLAAALVGRSTVSTASSTYTAVEQADKLEADLEQLTNAANTEFESLKKLEGEVSPSVNSSELAALYYSVMYFVDKKFNDAPTTCEGSMLGRPILDMSYLECGRVCDRHQSECKGISYFPNGICFLMSDIKAATYYKPCEEQDGSAVKDMYKAMSCSVKFSHYEGTSIAPTSKPCKECLREVREASACRLA